MQPTKIVSQRWAALGWLAGSAMLLVFLSVPAPAQQRVERVAQQSAEAWLAPTDSGTYGESWQQSASLFKAVVTQSQWDTAMRASREPLGKVVSRKLLSAAYTHSLPGAPDGEYVVIQYETRFEHKQSAVEIITPVLDKDGKWRVSGYFIK